VRLGPDARYVDAPPSDVQEAQHEEVQAPAQRPDLHPGEVAGPQRLCVPRNNPWKPSESASCSPTWTTLPRRAGRPPGGSRRAEGAGGDGIGGSQAAVAAGAGPPGRVSGGIDRADDGTLAPGPGDTARTRPRVGK